MSWLEDYFDRVVVINLDRRPDRYEQFTRAIRATDWPFKPPVRVGGVDGDAVAIPSWWNIEPGAWGCLLSHARVIEDAMRDGVKRLLVLEDDAIFVDRFREGVERFLCCVPEDWEQLYLGGLHLRDPQPLGDGVYACVSVAASHCYAVSRRFMARLHRYILDPRQYMDHPGEAFDSRLGALHATGTVAVYAPEEWLTGQAAGRSDVGGHWNPRPRFWNAWAAVPEKTMFVLLGLHEGGAREVGALLQSLGAHFGSDLSGWRPPYVEEAGLVRICEQAYPFPATERGLSLEATAAALRDWCESRLREAAVYGTVAVASYPQLCAMYEDMARAWPNLKVIDIRRGLDESIAALEDRFGSGSGGPERAAGALASVQRFLDRRRQQWLANCEHLVVDLDRLRADQDGVAAELRQFLTMPYRFEPQPEPPRTAPDAWPSLFEIGVQAYYRGEIELGRAACEGLLSLEGLPDGIVWQGRRNQVFYSHQLQELVPSCTISPVSFPVPEHWSRFNPSIAAAEDGYRMIVRSSNYEMERGWYLIHDRDQVIRTQNYLVSLRPNGSIASVAPIDDRQSTGRTFPFPVHGFEDCRLFHYREDWHVIATTREHNPNGVCQMALLRLVDGQFRDLRLLSDAGDGRHEKNWIPLPADGSLFFIYSFRPTVILRYEPARGLVEEMARSPGPLIAGNFRGGSQAIPLPGGFLCLVHESVPFEDGSRVYLHRFVLLDRGFHVTRVSPQFFFQERGIEYCAGLALRDERLVASLGVRDREAYLASMRLDEVLATLRPLG